MAETYYEGILADGTSWSLAMLKVNVFLTIKDATGRRTHREKISRNVSEPFKANERLARLFLTSYVEAFDEPAAPRHINLFYGFKAFTEAQLEAVEKLPDPLTRLMAFRLHHKLRKEDVSAVARLARTATAARRKVASSRDFSAEPFQDFKFTSATDLHGCLDLLSFFYSAPAGTTLPEWLSTRARQDFSLDFQRSDSLLGSGKRQLSAKRATQAGEQYYKLCKKSAKLQAALDELPVEELLAVLTYDLPSTLLVTDYLELIASLTHCPCDYTTSYHPYSYGGGLSEEVAAQRWGPTVAKELAKGGLLQRFDKAYQAKIMPGVERAQASPFYAHAAWTLGALKATELMETLAFETDGVSPRGFVELVRQGGFGPHDAPSWVVTLLP